MRKQGILIRDAHGGTNQTFFGTVEQLLEEHGPEAEFIKNEITGEPYEGKQPADLWLEQAEKREADAKKQKEREAAIDAKNKEREAKHPQPVVELTPPAVENAATEPPPVA